MRDRTQFENLTPLFPDEKFCLTGDPATTNPSTRIVDLFAPIGKGQRALIDTGSKIDEVIFEEFKGTGNMELQLDRSLANKRIFPAVNIIASSTRRDDLLLSERELTFTNVIRDQLADMTSLEAMNTVLPRIRNTKDNGEFLISINK